MKPEEEGMGWLRRWDLDVFLEEGVVEEAREEIRRHFAEGAPRRDMLLRLERWLRALQADPLEVLGLPPRKTNVPGLYRFPGDPRCPVSGYADLDLRQRSLNVIRIVVSRPGEKRGESKP